MKELLSLDLSRNRLRSGVFGPLPYLQRLNLSGEAAAQTGRAYGFSLCVRQPPTPDPVCATGNKLKTLSGVDHPHLEYINLANNRIKDASTLTAPSVTHLDIAGNKYAGPNEPAARLCARLCARLRALACARYLLTGRLFLRSLVSLDDIAIKTLKTLNVSENELRVRLLPPAFLSAACVQRDSCSLPFPLFPLHQGLEGIEAFTALESFAAENCGLTVRRCCQKHATTQARFPLTVLPPFPSSVRCSPLMGWPRRPPLCESST